MHIQKKINNILNFSILVVSQLFLLLGLLCIDIVLIFEFFKSFRTVQEEEEKYHICQRRSSLQFCNLYQCRKYIKLLNPIHTLLSVPMAPTWNLQNVHFLCSGSLDIINRMSPIEQNLLQWTRLQNGAKQTNGFGYTACTLHIVQLYTLRMF